MLPTEPEELWLPDSELPLKVSNLLDFVDGCTEDINDVAEGTNSSQPIHQPTNHLISPLSPLSPLPLQAWPLNYAMTTRYALLSKTPLINCAVSSEPSTLSPPQAPPTGGRSLLQSHVPHRMD